VLVIASLTAPPGVASPDPARCSWTAIPVTGAVRPAALDAVDALSPTDVWAAGEQGDHTKTLVVHWDGIEWSVVPSPNPGLHYNVLTAIDAMSADDVWAVGWKQGPSNATTLVEHWDGISWSVVPSPNREGDGVNQLDGVTAVAPDDVWAVGRGTGRRALLEHWNGTTWAMVGMHHVPGDRALTGAASVSADDVWAVGLYMVPHQGYHPLFVHWNGARWSQVVGPTIQGHLNAIEARTREDAWAVGRGSLDPRIITERWDGTAWTIEPDGPPGAELVDVASRGPNDATSVGYVEIDGGSVIGAIAHHWNGRRWRAQQLPDLQTRNSQLHSITPVPGSDQLWAVGLWGEAFHPLAERYC
jgi:hypothetical protein